MIGCNDDRQGGLFRKIDITPTHPIYSAGHVCPMSRVVGLPLVIYRHMPEGGNDAGSDNTIATFLMIDPVSGFAPPRLVATPCYLAQMMRSLFPSWQQAVGTVGCVVDASNPSHSDIPTRSL